MKLAAYLFFDGNCAEAMRYYAKHLGGKLEIMTYADAPEGAGEGCPDTPLPPEWRGKVMHACLTIGDELLMASDAPPPHFLKPQGFSVAITLDDEDQTERVFNALADGGTTTMPLGETFWAKRFGMCVDRFGIAWMASCQKEGA
ncbi:VOC family protein [Amphiplicatus metriothermophilus]|uniref:PhnB protein n=1 Tax=Amphiplicatus metriothermophilus TaxID=1519374 RepID=A0A239PZQ4_9PROT|nr:VOC family protein [Amphiplicatus metriothermophilus]MBB5518221.1 PhnB protein [Amphiplicatus metriothermophilus]SNT75412.1 PhnB protein [Amphiplicatus metriothermophilus]